MLTLQIGQCGNQLGHAFFSALARDTEPNASDTTATHESAFFRTVDPGARGVATRPVARAVLVDMEPKVVAQCVNANASDAFAYDARNTLTQQSGSGNNWALGFAGHGAQLRDALDELLRREAERCDAVHGVLTLQSAAGGTGSGVGSYLTEDVLPTTFPSAVRLNAVVWPYAAGEVIVQNYNAVLTIASLTRAADGVLVLPNDAAHAECQRLLRLARPSFRDLNGVLATRLAASLLPVNDATTTTLEPIMEISRQLCCHAGYKLLDIKTIPQMPPRSKKFTTHTWSGLLKHLHQMQIANAPLEEGIDWDIRLDTAHGRAWNRALSSMLVLRGHDTASTDVTAFRDPAMYTKWSLEPFSWFASSRRFNAYDKSATLLSNSKALLPTLASTVDKAYEMFAHGAYTHQYARHGVDDEFFQDAFLQVDQVVRNYQAL